ncbi:hypothetical protein [Streptomyces sp. NPDC001480]|uniref:hypothetical protein n=1 Tax=Streptomyces sp. NPDC001480 TaxID=3364577 RepID=UPI0036B8A962
MPCPSAPLPPLELPRKLLPRPVRLLLPWAYIPGNGEIARNVLTARLEALEAPPLLLVEVPAEDGGLDLLIYDEDGTLVDVSYVPADETPTGTPCGTRRASV